AWGTAEEAWAMVDAEAFYGEAHRLVFRAMMALFPSGEPIEPLTVIERLTRSGTLEAAGDRAAVLDIVESPYIAASYRTYADIVHATATQRRLLTIGQEIEATVARGEGEAGEMVQRAEDLVYELSQPRVPAHSNTTH